MLASPIQLYKKAYNGLSRNSWYLSIVILINRSGTMVIPFLTIYCTQQLHFTIVQAGYIMGLLCLGSITGAFVGGKLTDKYGFYDVQIGALVLGGVFFIVLGLQTTFWSLAIFAFVLSLCNDAFRPANSAAIAYHSSPETKTRSYSLNRLAINLGWACGGALGGFLASFNYHLLFWVDGCTNIAASVFLMILLPRGNFTKPAKSDGNVNPPVSAYRDKIYLVFVALVVLFATCFFQLFTIQPLFYKTAWHFNERFIGFLMAMNGLLIAGFEMVLIHNMEGKRHPLVFICRGTLLCAISFLILNLSTPSAIAALCAVLMITLGEMVSMPFINAFWIVRTTASNRGQYAALYSMAWSVAQVLAPFAGSHLISSGGFHLLWWVMTAACLTASGGFFLLYRSEFRGLER